MSTPLTHELYRTALPGVRKEPLRHMPRRLYAYVWRVSRRQQIRLCLLTVLVFPLSLVPLELQRRIVDEAIGNRSYELLATYGGIYLAALLVHGLLKYARNVYQNRTAEGVIRLLRRRIAEHERFGAETDPGTRQAIIASEAEKVGAFVGESVSFPLLQAGMVVSVAGYMLVVEPLIAAVAIAFFIPSLILVPILQQKVNALAADRTVHARELGEELLQEDETGSEKKAETLIERIYRLRIRIFLLKYFMKFFNNLTAQLGPLAVLMTGGWLAIQGETQVGVIVAFISGYERMTNPARDLLNFYRRLSAMRVQYGLVREAGDGSAGG